MYKISCFADEISPRLDQQLDEMEKLNVKWMSDSRQKQSVH